MATSESGKSIRAYPTVVGLAQSFAAGGAHSGHAAAAAVAGAGAGAAAALPPRVRFARLLLGEAQQDPAEVRFAVCSARGPVHQLPSGAPWCACLGCIRVGRVRRWRAAHYHAVRLFPPPPLCGAQVQGLIQSLKVVQAPTFIFFRATGVAAEGGRAARVEEVGRYVGSTPADLLGKVRRRSRDLVGQGRAQVLLSTWWCWCEQREGDV